MICKTSPSVCSKSDKAMPTFIPLIAAVIGIATVYTSVVPAMAPSGATGIVKERMDRFKASQDAMKAIANALPTGDVEAIGENAAAIEAWAREMVSYFPEGSNDAPSEARDAIWQNPDEFAAAAAANAEAALRLQVLAIDGDAGAMPDAFRTLAATCKSCHKQFRQ